MFNVRCNCNHCMCNYNVSVILQSAMQHYNAIYHLPSENRCQTTVKLLLKYHQVKFQKGRRIRTRSLFLVRMALGDLLRDCCPGELINELSLELEAESQAHGHYWQQTDSDNAQQQQQQQQSPVVDYFAADNPATVTTATDSASASAFVDEDDSIPGVSSTFRSISAQLKYLHSCFNGIIRLATATAANSASAITATPSSSSSGKTVSTSVWPSTANASTETPRKIRPITQVAASELRHQRLQKQLRQWFWWRYGSQRVLVDALVPFILEQRVYPRYPKTNATTLLQRNQVRVSVRVCVLSSVYAMTLLCLILHHSAMLCYALPLPCPQLEYRLLQERF